MIRHLVQIVYFWQIDSRWRVWDTDIGTAYKSLQQNTRSLKKAFKSDPRLPRLHIYAYS